MPIETLPAGVEERRVAELVEAEVAGQVEVGQQVEIEAFCCQLLASLHLLQLGLPPRLDVPHGVFCLDVVGIVLPGPLQKPADPTGMFGKESCCSQMWEQP